MAHPDPGTATRQGRWCLRHLCTETRRARVPCSCPPGAAQGFRPLAESGLCVSCLPLPGRRLDEFGQRLHLWPPSPSAQPVSLKPWSLGEELSALPVEGNSGDHSRRNLSHNPIRAHGNCCHVRKGLWSCLSFPRSVGWQSWNCNPGPAVSFQVSCPSRLHPWPLSLPSASLTLCGTRPTLERFQQISGNPAQS